MTTLTRHACLRALGVCCLGMAISVSASVRPRVIATTDGEIDDKQSMVRFLHYCNEWDTEGLIYANSIHHSVGHAWAGTEWIGEYIDVYEQDFPNLAVHDPNYPHPDSLRAVLAIGEIETVGWPSDNGNGSTAGSDLIIAALEKDDPRPVYVQCWGGSNTAVQALYDLKHNRGYSDEESQRIGSKMVIYLVTTQERQDSKDWVVANFPHVRMLFLSFGFVAYRPWQAPLHETWTQEWKDTFLCPNGALGSLLCSINSWGQLVEGDTPSFLYNVPNGLRGMELPIYGSWGGRFFHYNNNNTGLNGHMEFWHECEDDEDLYKPLERWWAHTGNDYASRSAWTATDTYADANHAPVVGDVGPLNREVAPGQTVTLNCAGSSDPDGNTLRYHWYQYYTWENSAWYTDTDPWSVQSTVTVNNGHSATGATFTVPNVLGKHLLITLEVTDDGLPALTRYAQIDFHIVENPTQATRPALKSMRVSSQGKKSAYYTLTGARVSSGTLPRGLAGGVYVSQTPGARPVIGLHQRP